MSTNVSLIVSHNNRVQCFLTDMFPVPLAPPTSPVTSVQNIGNGIRFQNCAILKVTVNIDKTGKPPFKKGSISVELVDSGTLNPGSKKGPSATTPYYLTETDYDKFENTAALKAAESRVATATSAFIGDVRNTAMGTNTLNLREFNNLIALDTNDMNANVDKIYAKRHPEVETAFVKNKRKEAMRIAKNAYETVEDAKMELHEAQVAYDKAKIDKNSYIPFKRKTVPYENKNMISIDNCIFFIAIHGEASTNLTRLTRDPSLTGIAIDTNTSNKDGINQSYQAGIKLRMLIDKIDYLFVSSLVRTHQTLKYMLDGMRVSPPTPLPAASPPPVKLSLPSEVYVLPCSHDLILTQGKCDLNNAGKLQALENMTTLNTSYKINELEKKWDFYNKNKTENKRCRDTTMIEEGLLIIEATFGFDGREKFEKYNAEHQTYKDETDGLPTATSDSQSPPSATLSESERSSADLSSRDTMQASHANAGGGKRIKKSRKRKSVYKRKSLKKRFGKTVRKGR